MSEPMTAAAAENMLRAMVNHSVVEQGRERTYDQIREALRAPRESMAKGRAEALADEIQAACINWPDRFFDHDEAARLILAAASSPKAADEKQTAWSEATGSLVPTFLAALAGDPNARLLIATRLNETAPDPAASTVEMCARACDRRAELYACCTDPGEARQHNEAKACAAAVRALASGPRSADTVDLIAHLKRQRAFSERTFGPGPRTAGVLDHIRKELLEIESDPGDLTEWIDLALLALDGAWRSGHEPEVIAKALLAKQARNETRSWPDWRTQPADRAIEHDRSPDPPREERNPIDVARDLMWVAEGIPPAPREEKPR